MKRDNKAGSAYFGQPVTMFGHRVENISVSPMDSRNISRRRGSRPKMIKKRMASSIKPKSGAR